MPRTREQDRVYLKAYRAANREKVRAQGRVRSRKWQEANKEKVSAKHKAYYAANVEKERARNAARYHENINSSRVYFRAWRKANPGKALAAVKAWIARNPEYKAATDAQRRSRKAGLPKERIDLQSLATRQRSLCGWCGKKMRPSEYSLDHIVPIAAGVSGGASHTYANVQLVHLLCNAAKGARLGSGVQPYLALTP